MTESAARIVVVGATGYTGTLVARRLAAGEAPFVLTGRSAERLARLARAVGGAATETVDVTEPATLRRLLRAGDVVINCAGPFTELGGAVVEACVRGGAHYLDTTGEQCFMKRVYERWRLDAREAGVAVVNAMAFEYAIGDCAAAVAAEGLARPLRAVDVVYAWRGGVGSASRGTRRSVLRVLRDGGYAYEDGAWRRQPTGAVRRTVRLPDGRERAAVWFPAGEILTVPRHVEVRWVRGWAVVGRRLAALVPRVAGLLPPLVRLAAPAAEWLLAAAPEGPPEAERRASRFLIQVDAVGADGRGRRVAVEGADAYGLTAAIAVHGAHTLRGAGAARAGVLAPAQVVEPRAFLEMLAGQGVVWREAPPGPG